jgi:putative addiction module killer protein
MVFEVRASERFDKWMEGLPDDRARERIADRLARLARGLIGDAKYFDGIGELRVDYGPGYRVYFVRRGAILIILLCGGDKSSQTRDIKAAKAMAEDY